MTEIELTTTFFFFVFWVSSKQQDFFLKGQYTQLIQVCACVREREEARDFYGSKATGENVVHQV